MLHKISRDHRINCIAPCVHASFGGLNDSLCQGISAPLMHNHSRSDSLVIGIETDLDLTDPREVFFFTLGKKFETLLSCSLCVQVIPFPIEQEYFARVRSE